MQLKIGRQAGKTNQNILARSLAISGIMALFFSAFLPAATTLAAPSSLLQEDVDTLQAAGNVGVLAQEIDHGASSQARAGVAELGTSNPVPYGAHYRTGSVTKTMVSAVVLQLVAEHKLSLDDTVNRWLPGVINGNGNDGKQITIRELLNHTSGLYNYTDDPGFDTTIDTPDHFIANRFHHYAPQDLINIALAHPPLFAPDTSWSYSNTNYIVVGEVIKAVTGRTWDKELKARIIQPLGLSNTTVPGDDPTIPAPFAHAYHIFTDDPAARTYTDTTIDNLTWGGSAGAVITTTADENKFLIALLSGKILKPAQLAEMQTTIPIAPGFEYGLGIEHETFTCSDGSTSGFWGHDGGTIGYTTLAIANPEMKRSVVLSTTTTTFSDAQYANDNFEGLQKLIFDTFCPGPGSMTPATVKQNSAKPAAPHLAFPDLTATKNSLKQ